MATPVQEVDCCDGNTCAAHVAYALSDTSVIYPITPSSTMGELADAWAAQGRKNIFDQVLSVTEMQSEAGAAGAVHGCLAAGALTSTFTASQGLLLMIPNLYKIAGERLPGVFHVSARAVAGQALSIFGDHTDVMACRQTGACLLCSNTVQECMDLALVAHLSAMRVSLPFIHFFDGFRTSHEVQKCQMINYETIKSLADPADIAKFRASTLNPEHPQMRGTSQGPDIFFQAVECNNTSYNSVPAVVAEMMKKVGDVVGRHYNLFDYYGAPNADRVVICMGSGASIMQEAVDYLNSNGQHVGVLKVHLYRPWSASHFLAALPASATRVCVMDRIKEAGSYGEPLFLDVCASIQNANQQRLIVGGRYGLGSKDFSSSHALAIFENLAQATPMNHFTVGINDDVTHTSLPPHAEINAVPAGTQQCLFWAYGSDGTVGANKEAIKLIGHNTDMYCQGYFEYDAKKSGGLTRSHLRFGPAPINAAYLVSHADYIACHHPGYCAKYELLKSAKQGGTFVLNCDWKTNEELEANLPSGLRREIATRHLKFYTIDGFAVAQKTGNGQHINMVMQTIFFQLANILPVERSLELLKKSVHKMYGKKGEAVIKVNIDAIDAASAGLNEVHYPASWAEAAPYQPVIIPGAPEYVNAIMIPCGRYTGDTIPVSTINRLLPGGVIPTGTSRFEKRGLAVKVPVWDTNDKCVQCCMCSLCCPHAVIRPYLMTDAEVAAVPTPALFKTKQAKGKEVEAYKFRIQISPMDCTGCGVCAQVCPVKCLTMAPYEVEKVQHDNWMYCQTLPIRDNLLQTTAEKPNLKASQFKQPLLEFSGACQGCGETPYVKLITQLYGERMMLANATGCSSIWGGSAPWCPYCANKEGHGVAWGNSLFEDAAEYGFGMFIATTQRRKKLADTVSKALSSATVSAEIKAVLQAWYNVRDLGEQSKAASVAVKTAIAGHTAEDALLAEIAQQQDQLVKKSQWIIGGDGWAYDIGYGGLDHVIAQGEDINILVMDTEVYSNTGGQRSKATCRGASALFATSGKKTPKKDLGMMAMSYGNVYVAQVALGANPTQYLRAIQEAESYPGPSLIIAYAPCINHGIKGSMTNSIEEEKLAVKFGYWFLYRFNPQNVAQGKNPFTLDSARPTGDLKEFIYREVRYESLTRSFPNEATRLHSMLAEDKAKDYAKYALMAAQVPAPVAAPAAAPAAQ